MFVGFADGASRHTRNLASAAWVIFSPSGQLVESSVDGAVDADSAVDRSMSSRDRVSRASTSCSRFRPRPISTSSSTSYSTTLSIRLRSTRRRDRSRGVCRYWKEAGEFAG